MTTTQHDLDTRRLASGLLAVIGPLRRALRREGRRGLPGDPLPASQAELLRLVRLQPGIGVREAAQQLGVAANTVSTLVNQLVAAGLLSRGRDPVDGRAARLELTADARRRGALWGGARPALHNTLGVRERATWAGGGGDVGGGRGGPPASWRWSARA